MASGWRVAGSLLTLLAEINAAHPVRDKRTDGTISGYPGAISSHNINAAGVVCALDITTGLFPGGLTPAQGIVVADKVRVALRDQPRGIPTYVIHNGRIASAGQNYAWLPYDGPDPHTSHIHVSVDWDIYAGGGPSGQADYDSTLPWGITAPPPSKDGLTVSDVNKILNELANIKAVLITGYSTGGKSYPPISAAVHQTRDISRNTKVPLIQEVADSKTMLIAQQAQLAGLTNAVAQLAGTPGAPIDMQAVTAAAEAGAAAALAGLKVTIEQGESE